ncbi:MULTISPECIES: fimbrial protein [unclassified Escherichia]|uniref:fimbrial protein n=1 Tax=unclassified Escherichia TaxID=2608889 RepID=UPI00102A0CBC|nr:MULTISPECIES: fimbrial protein [unclassified Escherichia]TGB67902.1 fimbrial protein [Escherichia coli]RZM95041.1 type 1 fimbrial protein [Escherichia sp. E14V5]RZN02482.1 type 1 fimbrial protein [Escherichia sp. E14V7]RZN20429.1 type 1 fimbrial protein [Escherichia sp. E14S1]RZN29288.1 type 1 fimbrial protein [Escherichia sp. E14V10]
MSKFVKAAVATAMLMGALTSASVVAAGNNGTVRFFGIIEDSPCSIVPDDHKLEVDMGSIGTGSLTGGKTTTPKDFQIRLQDCNFNTETTMTTTFTGNPYSGNPNNYSLSNLDNGTEVPNVSLVIGDQRGKGYDLGKGIDQAIAMDSSTGKGKQKQTLKFKAWLVGETAAVTPTPAPFETLTTFQITYL